MESVVKDYDLRRLNLLVSALAGFLGSLEQIRMAKEVAALDAVLVHSHRDCGELFLDLHGLVAVNGGAGAAHDLLEALALALVAAREHRDVAEAPVVAALKGAEKHLRMRSLAGAADSDVAYADGGDFGFAGLTEEAFVEEGMTDAQDKVIWKQDKFVNHRAPALILTNVRKNQRP